MRPLPSDKKIGVIHSVRVSQDDLDKVAEALKIPAGQRKRLRAGDEIHIVREAADSEMKKD